MKIQSLFFLLGCCMTIGAATHAATISGVVTFEGAGAIAGAPAPNIKIVLTDSTGMYHYFDTTRTSSSGAYSFTLPAAVVAGHHLTITPADPLTSYPISPADVYYSGTSFEVDFQTHRGRISGNQLTGYGATSGSTATSRFLRFYVIRKAYDPVAADTVLTATDSFAVADMMGYFQRFYSSVPSSSGASYLLKTVTQPADPRYATDLPTYYDSVLQWSSAKAVTNFTGGVSYAVNFKVGTNPGGPGFIGGSVLLGANKSTGSGDPLAKRIIILTNATTGTAVAYTYSDAAGHFQFSGIPYGTYKLFGDVWGKTNPALTITVSSSNGSVNNVLFKENRKDFTGQIGGLSVGGANALLAGISAYPNPTKDYVEVSGLSAISGGKTITICGINGAVITTQNAGAGQSARIATNSLAPGIYMLRVQTSEGTVQMRMVK